MGATKFVHIFMKVGAVVAKRTLGEIKIKLLKHIFALHGISLILSKIFSLARLA